jgi:hypothetical protein
MRIPRVGRIILAVCAFAPACRTDAAVARELKVHLAQANNTSPYAFVRARFEPGEVADPWAVRFVDDQGVDIPFFVWDAVTWRVAREGRADWGGRYALLNHAPGAAPEVSAARKEKLEWARQNLPALGARLEAQDEAARKAGDSVCAALYLLRREVPALGKDRITLRIDPERKVEPKRQQWQGREVRERVSVSAPQGELVFQGLPDRLSVTWKGKELLRSAGFDAGGSAGSVSHAEAARPFAIETTTGIITRLSVTGQTKWRQDGEMNWQCTYWLMPEGSYVALEGFSLSHPAQYLGGPQKLSLLATPESEGASAGFTLAHPPDWDKPWWLLQAGDRGFAAAHLFHATPLSIGLGNNPFTVNAEGPDKEPAIELDGTRLALRWFHQVNDPAIARLMARPSVAIVNGRTATIDAPSPEQAALIRWEPNVDWLYRQYIVGVGTSAVAAEAALRGVLGAAAGWIDRPVSEEEVAALLVGMMDDIGRAGQSAEIGLLKVVPAILRDDQAALHQALRDRATDYPARTDTYIDLLRRNVVEGGKPAGGSKLLPDGTRREGWTGNPCYHASLMPCYVRVLEHFDLPFSQAAHRQAILRYADFGLELLGGHPVDFDRLRTTLEAEWPSRVVPTIPLMLHAYTLKPDENYARAARILFQDLMRLVERNPHGYFPAWKFDPQADKYDTVYDPVSYERGLTAFWSDDQLDLIGRDAAARFVAAQARWFVFSGQLLDTLETDNATAIRACTHGGHTGLRNQIGIYLYDDFNFYRGLLGDLVAWSAATRPPPGRTPSPGTGPYRRLELSNAGSSMVRWALGIRPGSRWLESRVERRADQTGTGTGTGFRLQAWNRRPHAEPTIKVAAKEVGLASETDVLEVQLDGPSFREPATFEVTKTAGGLALKVSRPAKVRLAYQVLRPDWARGERPLLTRDGPGGRTEPLGTESKVVWNEGQVEWQARPGDYQLKGLPR